MKQEIKKEQIEQDPASVLESDRIEEILQSPSEIDPEQTDVSNEAEEPDPSIQSGGTYVERPMAHRVLAWTLFGVVVLGVILYYLWLSGVLK